MEKKIKEFLVVNKTEDIGHILGHYPTHEQASKALKEFEKNDSNIYCEIQVKDWETGNEKAARENKEKIEKIDNAKIGDGLTVSLWSDAHAGTIIKRTEKKIWIQRDEATLLDKPEFLVGGFAGHCTNNRGLKYSYETDPNGSITLITKRKNGNWKRAGSAMISIGGNVYVGRHEYYDYNF